MKMRNILLSFFIVFTQVHFSAAQCNSDELSNTCIPKLSGGFNFLKAYKINGKADTDKVEYSYVFAKGTQYMITLCEQADAKSIVLTIYDSQRNKVASSKIDGALLSAIAYPCNATGIYYLQYTFEKGSGLCAGSALGFKR